MQTDIKTIDKIFKMRVLYERAFMLDEIVNYIYKTTFKNKIPKLNFICTHNPRRSQFCQFWATFFSNYYNIKCEVYSGGTVETEVNKSVINNIRDYGFNISFKELNNPIYSIKFKGQNLGKYFSKLYHDFENPRNEFAAIMTCSDADNNCPLIDGAEIKFSLQYEDPKNTIGQKLKKLNTKKLLKKLPLK